MANDAGRDLVERAARIEADAKRIEELRDEAEFLCMRLREAERDLLNDDFGRQFNGHVVPPLTRLETLLKEAALANSDNASK